MDPLEIKSDPPGGSSFGPFLAPSLWQICWSVYFKLKLTWPATAAAGILNWGGPFLSACFFLRFEVQKRAPSLSYCFAPISRHQLLQVQPSWDFNNSIILFRVPMSLALSLCQYVLRSRRGLAQASPGLAQASPSLKAPRLQAFEARDLLHQHNRKRQVVMIKTRRSKRLVFGFVFCTLNWYEFWRRSGGLPCIGGIIHAGTKMVRNSTFQINCFPFWMCSWVMHLTCPSMILVYDSSRSREAVTLRSK